MDDKNRAFTVSVTALLPAFSVNEAQDQTNVLCAYILSSDTQGRVEFGAIHPQGDGAEI